MTKLCTDSLFPHVLIDTMPPMLRTALAGLAALAALAGCKAAPKPGPALPYPITAVAPPSPIGDEIEAAVKEELSKTGLGSVLDELKANDSKTPKPGEIEKKVIVIDPANPKGQEEFISCLMDKDWIPAGCEHKDKGVKIVTFIRPASFRIKVDGIGKPEVPKPAEK